MIVQYVARNGRSGFKSAGTGAWPPPIGGTHIDKTLWLVAQIEMPSGFGSIQNCHDNAVMSAGVLHHIAVVPKQMVQGSLWKLLTRMASLNSTSVHDLLDRIAEAGWQLGRDGVLRDALGVAVWGRAIMREITQSEDCVVPSPGTAEHSIAKRWAELFAMAFGDPITYETQKAFAAEWLLNSFPTDENRAYQRATTNKKMTSLIAAHRRDLPDHACLAMAVYHCFSANAPGPAREALNQIEGKGLGPYDFSQALIKRLGTHKYKNWKDNPENRSRYDRTRQAVERSGLWPADLIANFMPENFRQT